MTFLQFYPDPVPFLPGPNLKKGDYMTLKQSLLVPAAILLVAATTADYAQNPAHRKFKSAQ